MEITRTFLTSDALADTIPYLTPTRDEDGFSHVNCYECGAELTYGVDFFKCVGVKRDGNVVSSPVCMSCPFNPPPETGCCRCDNPVDPMRSVLTLFFASCRSHNVAKVGYCCCSAECSKQYLTEVHGGRGGTLAVSYQCKNCKIKIDGTPTLCEICDFVTYCSSNCLDMDVETHQALCNATVAAG